MTFKGLTTFIGWGLLTAGMVVVVALVVPVMIALWGWPAPSLAELPLAPLWQIKQARNPVPHTQLYPPFHDHSVKDQNTANTLVIPTLNVTVPFVISPSMTDQDVIAAMKHGAVLYPNGIEPGHLGNVFIAAHSTAEVWKGAWRFAFLQLHQVEAGHLIHINYRGTRYTYRVTSKYLTAPHPTQALVSDRPVPTLTLMTCWPLWSTKKRLLVTSELVHVTQLTHPPV